MKNKVVIIGCGNVGMSYCYALLNQRTYVNEIALIDLDTFETKYFYDEDGNKITSKMSEIN